MKRREAKLEGMPRLEISQNKARTRKINELKKHELRKKHKLRNKRELRKNMN